jgi:hypothetical protein
LTSQTDMQGGDARVEPEVPWTEYVDAIVRQRRLVLVGTAVAWGLILLAVLVLPRNWRCQSTLTLPTLEVEGGKEGARGVPLADYKALERTLGDVTAISHAVGDHMDEAEVRAFTRALGEHVTPITTNTRNEILRIDKEDTITAVDVAYEGRPPARVQEVVLRLAHLVRDALITNVALDRLATRLQKSTTDAVGARARRLELENMNVSLQAQTTEIEGLLARYGGTAAGPTGRDVVNTNEGGYRYLPPVLQVVGLRAAQADNAHLIRMARHSEAVAAARVAFYRQVSGAAEREFANSGTRIVLDMPALVRAELAKFTAGKRADDTVVLSLKVDANGFAESLEATRSGVRFIQHPTLRRTSVALQAAAAGALAVVVMLFAALVVDSWLWWHRA